MGLYPHCAGQLCSLEQTASPLTSFEARTAGEQPRSDGLLEYTSSADCRVGEGLAGPLGPDLVIRRDDVYVIGRLFKVTSAA